MVQVSEAFVPFAPVRLVRPDGTVRGYGLGSATDLARGAALVAATTAAVAGDKVEFRHRVRTTSDPRKADVPLVPMAGATWQDDSRLPDIDVTDLDVSGYKILYRSREAVPFAPEDHLCIFRELFQTNNDYRLDYTTNSNSSFVCRDGRLVYTTSASTGHGWWLSNKPIPWAQFASIINIEAHDPSPTATYNDACVGFGVVQSATGAASYTLTDKMLAIYRRTDATNSIFLQYEYGVSHTQVFSTPIEIDEVPPFTLICTLNQNSLSAIVVKDGRWRLLPNILDIPLEHWDTESQAVVARLRPLAYCQTDGNQYTEFSDWSVRPMASLAHREHVIARHSYGRPYRDEHGFYYVAADSCGPHHASLASPFKGSGYMRVGGRLYLYDADAARPVGLSAIFAEKVNGYVYGCQEVSIVKDDDTNEWHVITSVWNDHVGNTPPIRLRHYVLDQAPLKGIFVFEESQGTDIDMSALPELDGELFGNFGCYCSGYRKLSDGRWGITGTVNTAGETPDLARIPYMATGDTLDAMTEQLFRHDDVQTEGGYIWQVGGHPYAVTSTGTQQWVMDLAGDTIREFTLPGSGRYPHQVDLLEHVRDDGSTEYQFIGFSDTGDPTNGSDFQLYDGTYIPAAFGGWCVVWGGRFEGEEHSRNAK